MTVSGLTMRRAERQSCQHFAKVIQNSRSRKRREGRLAVRLRMASCWRRARISAISSRRGAKKERAREKRRGKRAISEKRNHKIQIQKWVSSIRGRSCKCKLLKVGLDFRYAHLRLSVWKAAVRLQTGPVPQVERPGHVVAAIMTHRRVATFGHGPLARRLAC